MERQTAVSTVDQRLERMTHPAEMAMKYSALQSDALKSMDKKKQVKTSDDPSLMDNIIGWIGAIAQVVSIAK